MSFFKGIIHVHTFLYIKGVFEYVSPSVHQTMNCVCLDNCITLLSVNVSTVVHHYTVCVCPQFTSLCLLFVCSHLFIFVSFACVLNCVSLFFLRMCKFSIPIHDICHVQVITYLMIIICENVLGRMYGILLCVLWWIEKYFLCVKNNVLSCI